MTSTGTSVVTGAFGYIGKYITRRLITGGSTVVTLTGHPDLPNEFGERVKVACLDFGNPAQLADSMRGADVLYNTYWIRFNYRHTTFDQAIENSRALIAAARDAGVRRVVHISITKPSADSHLPYYRGKALVEQALVESGLSYGILRPNIVFGDEGILINNIAWFLRHVPVFAVPGDGEYRVQPVFVEDLADLAVDLGQRGEDVVLDAVGPEIYTFNDLLALISRVIRSRTRLVHVSPQVALGLVRMLGIVVGDVVLTPEEIDGLLSNLLVSDNPPTAATRLSDWLQANADTVGRTYYSELKRHYR